MVITIEGMKGDQQLSFLSIYFNDLGTACKLLCRMSKQNDEDQEESSFFHDSRIGPHDFFTYQMAEMENKNNPDRFVLKDKIDIKGIVDCENMYFN